MPHVPSPDVIALVIRARMALGMTQQELADRLAVSRRTMSRYEAGERVPGLPEIHKVARMVHARDGALAAALAAEGGTTLEVLGLVEPRAAAAPAAPPAPLARPFPPIALMVDSVLLAAVDAAEEEPAAIRDRDAMRRVLRAAFARARGLGLTLEEVDEALAARQASPRLTGAGLAGRRGA